MVEIDLESKRHRAHPYRERQKERKRKVRVDGEQNLKLTRRIFSFFYVLIIREVITKMVAKMTDSIKED